MNAAVGAHDGHAQDETGFLFRGQAHARGPCLYLCHECIGSGTPVRRVILKVHGIGRSRPNRERRCDRESENGTGKPRATHEERRLACLVSNAVAREAATGRETHHAGCIVRR
jgi:hypothetical protein